MPKLTKSVIDGAESRDRPYFIWCSDLPGFGVRVFPSGKRVYYADYRTKAGTRQRLSIGPHGKLTAERARKLALVTLGNVLQGSDPAAARQASRRAMTVRELCATYLAATKQGAILGKRGLPKKKSTLDSDQGRIDRHIIPLLGARKVGELNTADLAKFVRDVTSGKTAAVAKTAKLRGKSIARGGRGVASRTLGLLGGILTFAVAEGITAANPARGLKRSADAKRSARFTPETYGELGAALAAWLDSGGSEVAVRAIRLLALTGCRRNEIVRLRWGEVDVVAHALRLADSKEGASVRPIGAPALAILAKVDRVEGTDHVCPGRAPDAPYGGLQRAWTAILAKADLSGLTLHTLRHSFASVAGDLGYSESTIAALLGHAAGSVTGRYVHHLDAVLIAAADQVSAVVADALDNRRAPAPGS